MPGALYPITTQKSRDQNGNFKDEVQGHMVMKALRQVRRATELTLVYPHWALFFHAWAAKYRQIAVVLAS